jgi:hypothetical protein
MIAENGGESIVQDCEEAEFSVHAIEYEIRIIKCTH